MRDCKPKGFRSTAIETESWGERFFQVTDPNGVVLQLVQWMTKILSRTFGHIDFHKIRINALCVLLYYSTLWEDFCWGRGVSGEY